MKRLLLLALPAILLLTTQTAAAQTLQPATDLNDIFGLAPTTSINPVPVKPRPDPKPPATPAPVVYAVVDGDNLSAIGTAYNVKWQRLFNKNTQIENPDIIHVGDQITIPLATEDLPDRPIPVAVSLPSITPGVAAPAPVSHGVGNYAGGNTYDYGYCTWYVKNRRGSSLPNGLGNANTWYARAQAMGMAVGSAPAPGAVGTTTRGALGHVVYVESVNDNGTITISEMNASAGFGAVDTRTANPSEFMYIY